MTERSSWPREPRPLPEGEPHSVLVVGGGVAAHRCVFDLRRKGYAGPVTLISQESVPAYDRTLLSKDMLAGTGAAEPVLLSQVEDYREGDIELVLGRRGVSLDAPRKRVILDDGTAQPFDRLVLAVGGRPTLPATLDAPGVLAVRDVADLGRLRAAMVRGSHVAVIGGGFIGGEIATVAAQHELQVTLVEAADQPLAPILGTTVGGRVSALHQQHGVKVLSASCAEGIRAVPGGFEIQFSDGSRLFADSVVVGVGMRPDTEWLSGSGVDLDDGILTDACCQTSIPSVFAAGDCARWWHPGYDGLCRVEHWDTANRHGAAVARNVLGNAQPFAPLPFFWSEQQGVKLQFAGYAGSWDDVHVDGDLPTEFSARYYIGEKLSGVLAAGQPRLFAQLRRELLANLPLHG